MREEVYVDFDEEFGWAVFGQSGHCYNYFGGSMSLGVAGSPNPVGYEASDAYQKAHALANEMNGRRHEALANRQSQA